MDLFHFSIELGAVPTSICSASAVTHQVRRCWLLALSRDKAIHASAAATRRRPFELFEQTRFQYSHAQTSVSIYPVCVNLVNSRVSGSDYAEKYDWDRVASPGSDQGRHYQRSVGRRIISPKTIACCIPCGVASKAAISSAGVVARTVTTCCAGVTSRVASEPRA